MVTSQLKSKAINIVTRAWDITGALPGCQKLKLQAGRRYSPLRPIACGAALLVIVGVAMAFHSSGIVSKVGLQPVLNAVTGIAHKGREMFLFASVNDSPRKTFEVNGDVVLIGNVLMWCNPDGEDSCWKSQRARNNTSANPGSNNDETMSYLDRDSAPEGSGRIEIEGRPLKDRNQTCNSSSADLTIPAGATIEWAGLYWAGFKASTPDCSGDTKDKIMFHYPGKKDGGDPVYEVISGQLVNDDNNDYIAFADVTAQVRQAQNSSSRTYVVGNISTENKKKQRYAGWGLVVVYGNTNEPKRHISVFDMFQKVGGSAPNGADDQLEVTLNGIKGAVSGGRSRMGVIAFDGDIRLRQDSLKVGAKTVVNTYNPADNVFNSSISDLGRLVTDRNPSYPNTMGLDIDRFLLPLGSIPPGKTSTEVIFRSTAQDYVRFGVITLSSDLEVAKNEYDLYVTKSSPAEICSGDNLSYEVEVGNDGEEAATNVLLEDGLSADVELVSKPGECSDPVNGKIKCTWNKIDPGEKKAFTITVRPKTGTSCKSITNSARVGVSVNNVLVEDINTQNNQDEAVTLILPRADLEIRKEASAISIEPGDMLTYTIIVRNKGPEDVCQDEIAVVDTLPTGILAEEVTTDTTPSFRNGNQIGFVLDGLAANTEKIIRIMVRPGAGGCGVITNEAEIFGQVCDSDYGNNRTSTSVRVCPSADLAVNKTTAYPSVIAGGGAVSGRITYKLDFLNGGPDAAKNVRIRDNVPANVTNAVLVNAPGLNCTPLVPGQQFVCSPAANGFGNNAAGVLPANAAGSIVFTADVPAGVKDGTIIGNATVITSEPSVDPPAPGTSDPNPANNTSLTTSTVVNTQANLAITKAAPVSALAGEQISYTIGVSNGGPSDAQSVVMTDDLPAGTSFVSVSAPSGWNCNTPAVGGMGTVSCSLAVLPANSAAPNITIVVRVNPGFSGSFVGNTATVSSATPEPVPDPNPNTATVNTTISALSGVTISKQITGLPPGSNPPDVAAGNLVSYTISLSNRGPSDATLGSQGLRDPLPAGTTFVAFGGTGILGGDACSFDGATRTLICLPNGTVPAGTDPAMNNVKLLLRINPDAPTGRLTNSAVINVVTANETGLVDGLTKKSEVNVSTMAAANQNPAAAVGVNVIRQPDIAITKSAPAYVRAGDETAYTIALVNNGPSIAAAGTVTVTDDLPAQLTHLGNTATGAGGFTFTGGGIDPVVFTSTADIPVGGTATLTIAARVHVGVPDNTQILNTAVAAVSGAPTDVDPVTANNTSSAISTTTTGADLTLRKTANVNSVEAGGGAATGQITYTITVRNNGPSNARQVRIEDNLPAFTNPVGGFIVNGFSFSPGPGQATPAAPTGACTIDAGGRIVCTSNNAGNDLLAGQGLTIQYTVAVPAGVAVGTIITNQARVASFGANSTPDPNAANNVFGTNTPVLFGADLAVQKRVDTDANGVFNNNGDPVIAGQFIDYRLLIENNGPSDAQNVVVTDVLPNNTRFVSVNTGASGFVCTTPAAGASGTISCTRAALPATNGTPLRIQVRVQVDSSATSGNVINPVSITSGTADPVSGNNSDSTTNPINTFSTVAKLKAAQPDPVVAGENLTYTLTLTNNGRSDAQNTMLTDGLPSFTSFVGVSGTGVFAAAGACQFDSSTNTLKCVPNAGPPNAVGVLPAGASGTATLIVKVAPNAPATIGPNSFRVTSDTPGVAGSSNAVTVAVIHRADLELVKTAPPVVTAGQVMDYTFKVTSHGPSDVNAGVLRVADTLPAGVSLISATSAGPGSLSNAFVCAQTGSSVTCDFGVATSGNFPAGGVATIVLKVKTDPSLPPNTNLVNSAVVSLVNAGDPVDPVAGNNAAQAGTIVQTEADLGAGKTATPVAAFPGSNPPAVRAGENIRYTISFGNAGPSDAVNVHLTDNVPGNTSMVTAFPLTVLATGGIYTGVNAIRVVCSYDATTHVISCQAAGNGGNPVPVADGIIPAGVAGTLIYEVKVNASVAGGSIIANAASITSATGGSVPATPDPNTGNNTTLTTSTPVVANPTLSITKSIQSATFAQSPPAAVGAVVPGTYLTYRITVRNNGPSDVAGLRVTDTLPAFLQGGVMAGVKYVEAHQSGGFGTTFTCAPPTGINSQNNPNGNGGIVQCTAPLMSAVAPNDTATIDVTVFIDPITKADLINAAEVNATANGFNIPVSAQHTLTTPVGPTSDLKVIKTHTPDPVIAGTEFDYTITVTNNGPSTAAMVSVTDTLPQYQTLAAVPDLSGAPGFVCSPGAVGSGGVITCTAPALAPNKKPDGTPNPAGTAVIRFRIKQDALTPQPTPVTYKNCVTAGSMSFDPDPANNTNYCDTVNVIFRADLTTAKTDSPDPVIAGRELTYTITAANNGQSAALNMMVNDPLPSGTVFVSASAPGSSALITPAVGANGAVKATWSGLTAPGVTRTVTIVVRVCSEVACNTTLTNTATASSETTDPKPADNAATTTTLVQAQADLAISKTGTPNPVGPGQQVTYTLSFSNKGPSGSVGTVVTDVLPTGFKVVGTPTSTVPGTTFAITTTSDVTTVKATLGVLGAANQCTTTSPTSGTMTIVALVPDKHPISTVINTASISTANCLADPDLSNNTAIFSTSVNKTQDQGFPFPASDEASDQKGGSVLIYPVYTSSASNPAVENTLINLTNISDRDQVCVHLYIIDGDTCSVADVNVCLTANQTVSFQAADFDPGTTGYLVAVAVDCVTGLPKSFNCLVGDSYVKFASGHAANLAAVSVSALVYDPAGTDQTTNKAELKFDGVHYNRLPRVVAMDSIGSKAEGNSTMLILNRLGGDFNRSALSLGSLFGYLYNDTEDAFSFTSNQTRCQARVLLSNSFPRIFGGFTNVISAGRSGWIKLWLDDDAPIIGSMINFNPNTSSQSSYSQGHNLHTLTLSDKAVLTVPVARPTC